MSKKVFSPDSIVRQWFSPNPRTDLALLLVSGIFIFTLVFKLPLTPFLYESDQLIFLYEAMRIYNGDVMYRDFFEFTFPGTQAFYALLFAVFGNRFWILNATVVLIGVSSFWICLQISKKVINNSLSYLPAILFVFFGFRWFGNDDGSHRMFSPIFIMLAVWVLLKGETFRHYAVAGVFCALTSFFTQQRGFAVIAAIAVFAFTETIALRKSPKTTAKEIFALSIAFVLFLAMLCGYFVFSAGFENFFNATFLYPATYYRHAPPNNYGIYLKDLKFALNVKNLSELFAVLPTLFYSVLLPLVYIAFALLFFFKRREHEWQFWRAPMLLAVIGFFLTVGTIAPTRSRIFQICMPALILGVWLLNYPKLFEKYKIKVLTLLIACLLILGAVQGLRIQTHWDYIYLDTPTGRLAVVPIEQTKKYQFLLANTKPGDYVYEVSQPFVYFPLALRNPTGYGQIWETAYTRPEHVAEVVGDLKEKQPQYIIWDNIYNKSSEERLPGDNLQPLYEFMTAEYKPFGQIIMVENHPLQFWEKK